MTNTRSMILTPRIRLNTLRNFHLQSLDQRLHDRQDPHTWILGEKFSQLPGQCGRIRIRVGSEHSSLRSFPEWIGHWHRPVNGFVAVLGSIELRGDGHGVTDTVEAGAAVRSHPAATNAARSLGSYRIDLPIRMNGMPHMGRHRSQANELDATPRRSAASFVFRSLVIGLVFAAGIGQSLLKLWDAALRPSAGGESIAMANRKSRTI